MSECTGKTDEGECRVGGLYLSLAGAVEAERAVLGLILEGSEGTETIVGLLGGGRCFSEGRHRIIYQTLLALRRKGKRPDLPTVVDELRAWGRLDQAGGAGYIEGLLNTGCDSSAQQYCQEIVEASRRNDLDSALRRARRELREGCDADTTAREITAAIEDLHLRDGEMPGYTLKTITEILEGGPQEISWCVEDLLPANGLGILSGESGCGKTWLILTLALAVSRGDPWLGRFQTTQGTVLILDEESGEDLLKQRLRLLGADSAHRQLPVWVACFQEFHLDTDDGQEDLVSEIKRVSASLVLVDSMVRVHTLDENSASQMQVLMGGLLRIARSQNCALLLTHHDRKKTKGWSEAGQALRGSTEIKAALDVHLHLTQLAEDRIRIEREKTRWQPPGTPVVVSIKRPKAGSLSFVADAKTQTKMEGARALILTILSDSADAVLKRDLEAACKEAEIGSRTFNKTLKALKVEGRIHGSNRTERDDQNRAKTYKAFSLL